MKVDRFEVLDSWRGICACMVAFFHFSVFSHLSSWGLIEHAYLFVDFFFVLSGFVIAINYRARLREGFGFGRFMLLRFGRIYPLHLATLLLFIPIDAAKDGIGPNLWRAIVTNALLLHGLGVNEALWLNFPSWSISAEFAAYAVFALVVIRLGAGYLPWILPVVLGPLVLGLISPNGMDSTYDFGLLRCLYGFALGVVCVDLRAMFPAIRRPIGPSADTLIEAAIVVFAVFYLAFAGSVLALAVLTPFLFAVLLLVFAREAGAVSRFMKIRPLLMIGTLSYSIYMVHALVRAVTRAAAMVLEHFSGVQLFIQTGVDPKGEPVRLLAVEGSLWLGDVMEIAMLAATIGLAVLTYRYIEEPGRQWSRRLAGKSLAVTAPVATK